ncbi:MAG: Holliday junction branch migration protein RuvA [Candidatus Firestonebacteria bacterium]
MIASIKGILEHLDDNKAVVDVNGIGYEIFVARIDSLPKIGIEVKLYTYLHITQEGQYLYGFLTLEEKLFFKKLISISDIGPKVALTALSKIDINKLKEAIVNGDIEILQTIPRIGRKLATRIIVELKETLELEVIPSISSLIDKEMERDLIDALISLGYNLLIAKNTLEKVKIKFTEIKPTLEELIKESLRELGR